MLVVVRNGFVGVDEALRTYGVAVVQAGDGWRIDEARTAALRAV